MSVMPNYVPRNLKTITFLLTVNDADRAIRFYNNGLGAEVLELLKDPDGVVRYAELKIDDTVFLLTENKSAPHAQGVTFRLYTGDAEGLFDSVLLAGGIEVNAIHEKYYGERSGLIRDPFGYYWEIATHIEDVPPSELKKRFDELFS